MVEEKLTILGVYRPQISPETWQEQWQVTGDDEATKEHFDTLVLIEAIVEGMAGPFEMGHFGQMQKDFPTMRTECRWGMTRDCSRPMGKRLSLVKWIV